MKSNAQTHIFTGNAPVELNPSESIKSIAWLSNDDKLLRAKQIHAPNGILPISRSSFLDYVARGIIPKPIKLGPRTSCWRKSDILAFVEKMEASND